MILPVRSSRTDRATLEWGDTLKGWCGGGREKLPGKGQEGPFWGDHNVLYLERGFNFTGTCMHLSGLSKRATNICTFHSM